MSVLKQNHNSQACIATEITTEKGRGHSVLWWSIKVLCGAALIANLIIGAVYQFMPSIEFPTVYAQGLVFLGGLGSLSHYWVLKKCNTDISQPWELVASRGLYKHVRHPMYLFDCLSYVGLFLLFANPLSATIVFIAIVALVRQAKTEDHYLHLRFGADFIEWRNKTRLLIPYIY